MERLCKVEYPGSNLKCIATSETEVARARKIKETWTAQWAASLPSNAVFYDIGANIGIMALLACEARTKNVLSMAFEPAATNFPSLLRNIELNGLWRQVAPLAVGLGERTCLDSFNYQNTEPGGSLHSFGALTQFKVERSITPVRSMATLCYALDDFVSISGIPFPSHIKIDVDGTEAAILKGGMRTLSDIRVVEVQVEAVDFGPDHLTSNAIISIMSGCGFSAFDVFNHNSRYPLCRDFRFRRAP